MTEKGTVSELCLFNLDNSIFVCFDACLRILYSKKKSLNIFEYLTYT